MAGEKEWKKTAPFEKHKNLVRRRFLRATLSNAMINGRFLSRGVRLARCSCSDFLSKLLINLTARMTKLDLDLEATRTPTVNEPSMVRNT